VPWLGPLLAAGAIAFGRLITVNLLPSALLTTFTWWVIKAEAFSPYISGIHLDDLANSFQLSGTAVLPLLIATLALAVLLKAFEIRAVQVLEGYVGPFAFRESGRRRHHNKLTSALETPEAGELTREEQIGAAALSRLPLREQARRHREWQTRVKRDKRARRIRALYPQDPDDVMPTLLGNELRAAERRAGERYYLSTVGAMPRLYPELSERLTLAYHGSRDTLDSASMLSITFGLLSAEGLVAFYNDVELLWMPGLFLVASLAFYRAALLSALQVGTMMDVAFDLHRFDLLRALHLTLPSTASEEKIVSEHLTEFWRERDLTKARDAWRQTTYHHDDGAVTKGRSINTGARKSRRRAQ
jgi:hypothetical protein